MKESTSTALLFGAALFLTLALIGLAVNVFTPSTEAAKTAQTEFSTTTKELKDQKYLIFDNTAITGSQVMAALRKFEKEGSEQSIALHVATGKNPTGTWYYSSFTDKTAALTAVANGDGTDNLAYTSDVTNIDYINPSGMFDANIERDSNGVIRAIKFKQQ